MSQTKHPVVPKPLLEWLEASYPDRCPSLQDDERVIWMRAGQADLVRKLRQSYEAQTKDALTQ